jgi:hypothetical protein
MMKVSTSPGVYNNKSPECKNQGGNCLKGKARTKPGTLLKKQIPIRTFSQWDEGRPGFVEVDFVSHDGGNSKGVLLPDPWIFQDVATEWTETRAVKNKARIRVFQALQEIGKRLPFEIY